MRIYQTPPGDWYVNRLSRAPVQTESGHLASPENRSVRPEEVRSGKCQKTVSCPASFSGPGTVFHLIQIQRIRDFRGAILYPLESALEDAWSQTKKELQKSAKDSNVRSCLQSLRPIPLNSGSARDHFVFELDDESLLKTAAQLRGPIQTRLSSLTSQSVSVEFRLAQKKSNRESNWVRPQLDLSRCCEGKANRIPLMAARNIVEQPRQGQPSPDFRRNRHR